MSWLNELFSDPGERPSHSPDQKRELRRWALDLRLRDGLITPADHKEMIAALDLPKQHAPTESEQLGKAPD